jgi:DUF438 domain-containing protein
MNPIEKLQQEHRDIERELFELETIIQEQEVNYPNLIHVFKKLSELWEIHEKKEERIFPIFRKEKIIMPVKTMLLDHGRLRSHREKIILALNSGDNQKVRECLDKDLKFIIIELQKHIDLEDEILYRIVLSEFTSEELTELWARAFEE